MNNKYNTTKSEFLEYIKDEIERTRSKLEGLNNRLREYDGGNLGRVWNFIVEKREGLIKRINYMEGLFLPK